ncbi:MAG: hypothetical protein QM770_01310 [Tepidisphaeraceae bacterium]
MQTAAGFVYTNSSGQSMTFDGGFQDDGVGPLARVSSSLDAGGNGYIISAELPRDSKRRPRQKVVVIAGGNREVWNYAYDDSIDARGRLLSVEQKLPDGADWKTYRKIEYTYYTASSANGRSGQIRTATVSNELGHGLITYYYRYYTSGTSAGKLKFVLGGPAYDRARVVTSNTALDSLTDAQIAPHALLYFTYDSSGRIASRTAQGEGCSACTGGQGTTSFVYEVKQDVVEGFNTWKTKKTEQLPDGSTTVTYYNAYGQSMLDVTVDASGSKWGTFHQFDTQGREVLTASPSAVALPASLTTIEQYPDLLHSVSGNYQYLSDSTGLIEITEYYSSNSATDVSPGGVAGRVATRAVKNGEAGTQILQSATHYLAHTTGDTDGDGDTDTPSDALVSVVYVVADTAVYALSGALTQGVTYTYTWFPSSLQPQTRTVTHDALSTAQNGSGGTTSETEVYDVNGHLIWERDASGFLTYHQYDTQTGAETLVIRDVNTSLQSGSPWTTPTGGGKHLVTQTGVDAQGRPTKFVDPNGNVTWTVYNDETHETRVYRGWNATTGAATGPTEVSREDYANGYSEQLTMSATPSKAGSAGSYYPTGAEAISSVQSLTRTILNDARQVEYRDVYSSLTSYSPSSVTLSGNYLRTEYGTDWRGRQARVKSPDGTWTHTVYDALGRVTSVWRGTNNTGWTQSNPAGSGGANNMVKVSSTIYDNGGIGDGNATESRAYFGSGTTDFLTTKYVYDWRDRLTDVRGPDGVATKYTLDNQGRQTEVYTFADADVDFTIDTGELRGQQTSEYDSLGRVFRSTLYNVSPVTGLVGHSLTTNYWYDPRGNLVKTASPNGLFSKNEIDGAGRTVASYLSYDDDESSYSEALDVAGDTVIEQQKTIYDKGSRPVVTTSFKRTAGSIAVGALTSANSYIQTGATWYDAAGRVTEQVNFGRDNGSTRYVFDTSGSLKDGIDLNGDGDFTDSGETAPDGVAEILQVTAPAPNSSDDYIVSKVEYDAAGRVYRTTDNLGHKTVTSYDLLGRRTKMIENYVDGVVSSTDKDTDRTTEWQYDAQGRLTALLAYHNTQPFPQTTKYLYADDVDRSRLTYTIYPDASEGMSYFFDSTGKPLFLLPETDLVTTTYDRLGRVTTTTDQRGVQHSYTYYGNGVAGAGQLKADVVTALGSAASGGVRRIERTYDDLGRVGSVASFSTTTIGDSTYVNEVRYTYDGWGNVASEAQSQGAWAIGKPTIYYTYEDGAGAGNAAKYVRLTQVTYPSGRTVYYNYPTSGDGYYLSRLDNIAPTASPNTSSASDDDWYAKFEYLGASTITAERRPANVGASLIYNIDSDWDRFGRVLNHNWTRTTTPSPTVSATLTTATATASPATTPPRCTTAAPPATRSAATASTSYTRTTASIA